jgi:hypothetical protein
MSHNALIQSLEKRHQQKYEDFEQQHIQVKAELEDKIKSLSK